MSMKIWGYVDGGVLRLRERVAHPTDQGWMCNPLPSLRTNGEERDGFFMVMTGGEAGWRIRGGK